MENITSDHVIGNYKIISGSLSLYQQNEITQFIGVLGKNEQEVRYFYDFYFKRYNILHEIGHIIRNYFGLENDASVKGATEEYIVNLFAVKYLQFIKDVDYIMNLRKMIDYLLELNRIHSNSDINKFDNDFSQIKSDLRLYGAMQFLEIKSCMLNKSDFYSVVKYVTNNKITEINPSIQFCKNKTGNELIEECMEVVFSLHEKKPIIMYEENKDVILQKSVKLFY